MSARRERTDGASAATSSRGYAEWAMETAMASHYRITIQGTLDDSWSAWFDGLALARDADGTTTLAGAVRDQAALHGLLARVRDLGLTLLAVERVSMETVSDQLASPGDPDDP